MIDRGEGLTWESDRQGRGFDMGEGSTGDRDRQGEESTLKRDQQGHCVSVIQIDRGE